MGKLEHLYCNSCGTINPITECLCISCFQPLNLWQDHSDNMNDNKTIEEEVSTMDSDKTFAHNLKESTEYQNLDELKNRLMTCPNNDCEALIDIIKIKPERSLCPYCLTSISLPTEKNISPKTFFIEFPWGREKVIKNMFFGRDSSTSPYANLLYPKYENISRNHAELIYTPQKVFIRDLGSTNGTFVNDTKLFEKETLELNHGDKVRLAKKFVMIFIEYSE